MGLVTYSDKGFMGHAGEALAGKQAADSEYANEMLTRARTDAVGMQARADLERNRLADQATRERAARNLGIAVEELASLGVDPTDVNMADDLAFIAQRNPGMAQNLVATFGTPEQKTAGVVAISKARRALEQGEAQGKKRGLFQGFMQRNSELLGMDTSGGQGAQEAENPLLTELRTMAQDQNVDADSFRAALTRVEGGIVDQVAGQFEYESTVAAADKLMSERSGSLLGGEKQKRAAQLYAKIKHASPEQARESLVELALLVNGLDGDFQKMMDAHARQAVTATLALQKHDQLKGGQGAAPKPGAQQPLGPNGLGPDTKPGAGSVRGKPAASDNEAYANITGYIERNQTGREFLHLNTLLNYASEQLGRAVDRDGLRDFLLQMRGSAANLNPDDHRLVLDRLTVSGRAKSAKEAEQMLAKMTPEQIQAELDALKKKHGEGKRKPRAEKDPATRNDFIDQNVDKLR